jgi:hypothetical protein
MTREGPDLSGTNLPNNGETRNVSGIVPVARAFHVFRNVLSDDSVLANAKRAEDHRWPAAQPPVGRLELMVVEELAVMPDEVIEPKFDVAPIAPTAAFLANVVSPAIDHLPRVRIIALSQLQRANVRKQAFRTPPEAVLIESDGSRQEGDYDDPAANQPAERAEIPSPHALIRHRLWDGGRLPTITASA